MSQNRKLTLTKQISKYSSGGQEFVEEGMIGFSNKLAEDYVKMKMLAEGQNFDMEDEDIKQFRNSIYNFNRMGVSKGQIRAKIYNKETVLETTGRTTERYDEARKRYDQNLGKVEEFLT